MADPDKWPIRINSIGEAELGRTKEKYIEVRLRVDRPYTPFEVPFLLPTDADDASLVPLARNYFHRTMKLLAEQTANWELTDDEVEALRSTTKPR